MKKFYHFLMGLLLLNSPLVAQVSLPYTLDFTANDAAWSGGIAHDGEGGTSNITGLNIEIYAADATNFNLLPGAIMRWLDNSYYFSGDNTFNGITPGPDPDVTNNGVPALVIKSDNTANNFSLESIEMYDWGGSTPWIITTYDNGTEVGSITVNFQGAPYPPKTISQSDELTPSVFKNIDEVRITGSASSPIWPAINKISLGNAVALPVSLYNFSGQYQFINNSVLLKWETASEIKNDHFEIQRSLDGRAFETLHSLSGAGTSNITHQYQYTDYAVMKLAADKLYYRLKQIDEDGHANYSKIILIVLRESATITKVYPNPGNGQFVLQLNNIPDKPVLLKIYDNAGRLIQQQRFQSRTHTVDLTGKAKGIYYLELQQAGNSKQNFKLLKD